ncbi:MAG: hypothetical protein KDA17_06875 [Candidatus Saccharibacteria bacterium]|nr:hypothetical protein [Candidatus Saccharibacteria bacterium]
MASSKTKKDEAVEQEAQQEEVPTKQEGAAQPESTHDDVGAKKLLRFQKRAG